MSRICFIWLVFALANLMLCLKKSTIWPQKWVAEVLSWDVNQNPIDLLPMHTWIMRSHGVLNKKMTCLRCTGYILNIRIRCVLHQRAILPKHAWIMRLHCVLILKYIVLLFIFHSLKLLGWLVFSWCFAHLGWSVFNTFSFSCCVYNGRRSWGDFS